jgi:general stress protein 26
MIDQAAVLELMTQSEAVYLATVSGGAPRIRALVNLRRPDLYPGASDFCRREGFTSYFCTSSASGKANDLRESSSVAVYYSDPPQTRGVELRGTVEIVTDPVLKARLWQEVWRIYWAGGPDDADYVVLRLSPSGAAGWWGTAPFQLELAGA